MLCNKKNKKTKPPPPPPPDFKHIRTKHSKLIWCKPIDIRWGDITQLHAEFCLFESAIKEDCYEYFHLLSGVDLPLKSQEYIHCFFNQPENKGKKFIHYVESTGNKKDTEFKIRYYHWFTRWCRKNQYYQKHLLS